MRNDKKDLEELRDLVAEGALIANQNSTLLTVLDFKRCRKIETGS